ncbi:MAG TPA: HemK/PrmC family methyltransferase, partial [Pyrinomonadaceae bacterium]|nr:HemK/PrmC family methyltransferase [Pyrinomonadaceae bacterium]
LVNVKHAKATCGDISEKALAVAAKNAEKHDVSERLNLLISDVYSAIPNARFDAIVSNPPYVPKQDLETLQVEVAQFEPHIALSDGADGLSIVRRIVADAPDHLESGGILLMEIGFDQADRVEQMFDRQLWRNVKIEDDLQGIPRMVNAVRK